MRSPSGPAASFATAAVLAVVCVLMGATGAQAVPTTVPLQATFEGLLPGSSASKSWQFTVPHDAQVTRALLREQGPGGAVWHAQLCPSVGAPCVDLMTASVGTTVPAGDYALTVGVVVTALEPGSTHSVEGRFVFAETGGGLAQTGAQVWSAALASLVAAGVGVALLLLARRRKREEPADDRA
jgi:LPXTG-motif cell wall-anchored protein